MADDRDYPGGAGGSAPVSVRAATPADIGAMSAIYAREAREGHATFDLEPRPLEAWAAYVASTEPGDAALVAVDRHGSVLGFAYSSAYRTKPAYAHTRESTIYVAPAGQGRGVGRLLYAELIARMRDAGVHLVVAAVALPNDASVRLHRSFGFERVGTLPEVGRKHERWIDVDLYALVLR